MTACIVGWSHGKFGKLDGETSESLIVKAASAGAGAHRLAGRRLAGSDRTCSKHTKRWLRGGIRAKACS